MQPADRCTGSGAPERLELVVPGLAEQPVDLLREVGSARSGCDQRRAQAVLRDHEVTVHADHGREDAERRRAAEPDTVAAWTGFLGHLEAEQAPPAQPRGDAGRAADFALPRGLRAQQTR